MRWYFNRRNENKKTAHTLALTLHWTIIVIIEAGRGKEKWNDSAKEQEQRKSDTVYLPINITERKKTSTATNFNVVFIWFYRANETTTKKHTKPNWAIRLKPLNIMKVVNDRTNMKVCMRVCRRKSKHTPAHFVTSNHWFCSELDCSFTRCLVGWHRRKRWKCQTPNRNQKNKTNRRMGARMER